MEEQVAHKPFDISDLGRDELTGLLKYGDFVGSMEQTMDRAVQTQESVSLGLIDIDWFGRINDEHGSSTGDGVLKELAGFLRGRFTDQGSVFRYGGDAFAVLLEGTEKEQAFLLLEDARKGFDGPHTIPAAEGDVTLPLTVSAGLASYPDDGASPHELVRKANGALYRAKVGERNRVCLAREEKMVTKTSHYTQGQLHGLSRLAKREGIGEAVLLREALDDLLRKYNA